MRLARIDTANGPSYAVWRDEVWHHIGDPFAKIPNYSGALTASRDARLLAPVQPSVIVGIGHNDADTGHPLGVQAWHKSVHTLANPGDRISVRRDAGIVNVEGELAVVIGKRSADLTRENASRHVLGYTIANDVTNADQVHVDERLFQSKGGNNYTPLGPWIETEIQDPDGVSIEVAVNDSVQAQSGTFNLPSIIADCLVYVTKWVTLEPGDIVMTGAPGTAVPVLPGDRVAITLSGIGTLTNSIV